jgi:hypothetical protein
MNEQKKNRFKLVGTWKAKGKKEMMRDAQSGKERGRQCGCEGEL